MMFISLVTTSTNKNSIFLSVGIWQDIQLIQGRFRCLYNCTRAIFDDFFVKHITLKYECSLTKIMNETGKSALF